MSTQVTLGSIDFLTGKNSEAARAFKVAISTSQFERNFRAFEKICLALNNLPVDFEHHQLVEIPYMCWAVAEVRTFKTLNFSDEVKTYIKKSLEYFNYLFVPEPLDRYITDYNVPEEVIKMADMELQRQKELACKYYVEERTQILKSFLKEKYG